MHFAPAMYVGATPWARPPVGDGQNTLKTAERNDCEFSFPRRKICKNVTRTYVHRNETCDVTYEMLPSCDQVRTSRLQDM